MTIQLYRREVYGRILFYPANDTALYLCSLLGTKTLAEKDFALLRQIGFEIEITERKTA